MGGFPSFSMTLVVAVQSDIVMVVIANTFGFRRALQGSGLSPQVGSLLKSSKGLGSHF